VQPVARSGAQAAAILAVIACAAAGVAVILAWRCEPAVQAPSTAVDRELAAAVRTLQQELAELRARPAVAPVVAPAGSESRQPADTQTGPRVAELEQRLARLEARFAALTQAPTPDMLPPEMQRLIQGQARQREEAAARTAQERLRLGLAEVPALQAQFADTSRTEEERLQALRELRGRGPAARTGAAADAAIDLVRTSTNAATRADVWRQMSRAGEPRLVPHLLLSLRADPDRAVREEAAETLADYLKEPGVEAALRAAMDTDTDQRVRRQAAESLTGGR
jgi:hypothetical protein